MYHSVNEQARWQKSMFLPNYRFSKSALKKFFWNICLWRHRRDYFYTPIDVQNTGCITLFFHPCRIHQAFLQDVVDRVLNLISTALLYGKDMSVCDVTECTTPLSGQWPVGRCWVLNATDAYLSFVPTLRCGKSCETFLNRAVNIELNMSFFCFDFLSFQHSTGV